jgi:transcriptional regulator with XRE-family HTH domain
MDISTIMSNTPDSILGKIAEKVKRKRLERNLTQKAFAKRAGVGYDAYLTFERTGEITFRNLVLCAIVLDEADAFTELFTKKTYQSIDELVKTQQEKKRKRGSKNE